MISRREVMTAGVIGTLATANPSAAAEIQAAEVQALKDGFKNIEDALNELKQSADQGLRGNSMNFGNVGNVKGTIEKWTKISARFPEFCDIGLGVFYDVYDWHVRHNQQIQISRNADNRIMIVFMFTQLIVRWENDLNYVGIPY
jgi:hypothetical protein